MTAADDTTRPVVLSSPRLKQLQQCCFRQHATTMARVTAGGCNAAQISPEISDDDVFDANTAWRPLQALGTNGRRVEVPQQTLHLHTVHFERSQEVPEHNFDISGSQHRQHVNFRSQNESSDKDDPSWNDSTSFRVSGNTNNNRPGAVCSAVPSEMSQPYDRPWSGDVQSEAYELQCRRPHLHKLERQQSIVDGLLFEIYDRWHGSRADSFDSDTFTECSSTSEIFHTRWDSYYDETTADHPHAKQFHRTFLENQSKYELNKNNMVIMPLQLPWLWYSHSHETIQSAYTVAHTHSHTNSCYTIVGTTHEHSKCTPLTNV